MQNRLTELLPAPHAIKTDVVIEPSLDGAAAQLVSRVGLTDKRLLIVCDDNTHAALSHRLMQELSGFSPRLLKLQGHVRANDAALRLIRGMESGALIAVGGGSINDLCKYASFLDAKPYAVFPTAPSMNGYLSANASIAMNGVKESHPAHLPSGVFCDLQVMASAPIRLLQSGLGDSLCRPTAQADWLLSHLLLGTPYAPEPFLLLAPYEEELFRHSDKILARDIRVVELLVRTLLVSGLGMTLAGGSQPASQGEHMIAHTMEMKHEAHWPQSLHGEQIGVTTLTMARLQHEVLARPLRLPSLPQWEEALHAYFENEQAERLAGESRAKYRLYERYDAICSALEQHDASLRERLRQVILPEAHLRAVLEKAGAPTMPHEVGWGDEDYRKAVSHARFTRNRFTFLDLI